jgi:hypothetical protein
MNQITVYKQAYILNYSSGVPQLYAKLFCATVYCVYCGYYDH